MDETALDATNKWVLIAEDEVDFAELIKSQLLTLGFKVVVSQKISEAMMKVKNQKFDVILLDLRLEQGSGERIVEYIRTEKQGYNFTTPVILMSGYIEPEVLKRIGKLINGALVKPVDTQALIERIKVLCELTG